MKTAGVVNVLTKDTDFTARRHPGDGAQARRDPDLRDAGRGSRRDHGAARSRLQARPSSATTCCRRRTMFKKMGTARRRRAVPGQLLGRRSPRRRRPRPSSPRYEAKFNAQPDIYSAQGYEVVWFIAQGLKSITGTPTRESLATALSKVTKIDHQVYGGEEMKDGQAETTGTLVVNWTADGKIVPWTPAEVSRPARDAALPRAADQRARARLAVRAVRPRLRHRLRDARAS